MRRARQPYSRVCLLSIRCHRRWYVCLLYAHFPCEHLHLFRTSGAITAGIVCSSPSQCLLPARMRQMVQHRITKRSGEPPYKKRLSVVERLLAANQDELQQAKGERQQLELRELILLEVVRHQEALDIVRLRCQGIKASSDVLRRGSPTLEATPVLQSLEQQGTSSLWPDADQTLPDNHYTRPFADTPGHSYSMQLLQNVTMQQIWQVLDMTVDGWIEYFQQLYIKLTALLNLAAHATEQDWATVKASAQSRDLSACPEHAATISDTLVADSSVGQHSTSHAAQTHSSSQPLQHLHTDHQTGADVSAAAVAAAGMQGVPPPHVPGVCIAADMLRLNQLVDECSTLLLLAAMMTPDKIMGVMYTHLGTRQRYTIPPAVKQVIAAKLRLTNGQAQQLAACFQLFRSIHASTDARCSQLIDQASDVGIMVAAATAEKAKASLAASAASGGRCVPAVGCTDPATSRPTASKTGESSEGVQSADKESPSQGVPSGEGSSPRVQTAVSEDAADAAAEDNNNIGEQLQGQLQRRFRLQHLEYIFITDTLTYLQRAALLVASYPVPLVMTATAEAVEQTLGHSAAGTARAPDSGSSGSFANSAVRDFLDAHRYWRCMQEDHEQRRNTLLERQRQQWWKELQDDWGFML